MKTELLIKMWRINMTVIKHFYRHKLSGFSTQDSQNYNVAKVFPEWF